MQGTATATSILSMHLSLQCQPLQQCFRNTNVFKLVIFKIASENNENRAKGGFDDSRFRGRSTYRYIGETPSFNTEKAPKIILN